MSSSDSSAAAGFCVKDFFRERELPFDVELMSDDEILSATTNLAAEKLRPALIGWEGVRFVYRGQLDESWGLTSSLVREVAQGNFSGVTEERLCAAEQLILQRARDRIEPSPAGGWLGRGMTAGELLAVLQHQEAPTRFLDVTDDALVALYFAVEREDTTDGRVFFIALNDPPDSQKTIDAADPQGLMLDLSIKSNNEENCKLPWPSTGTKKNSSGIWTNRVYLVDTGSLDPRMRAQAGKFLVGGSARAYGDFKLVSKASGQPLNAKEITEVTSLGIGFRTECGRRKKIAPLCAFAWSIRIPGRSKPRIRELLKAGHGIHRDSLFPEYREFKRLAQSLARGSSPSN